jgi:DNA/RNA-binding domain of Phe-tRNA-synthetase-like protein
MPRVRFVISPQIFELFPRLRVVVVAGRGLDATAANPGVDALLDEAWRAAGELGLPNPQSHPRVGAWREAFRSVGVSPREFPSSIEALLRRAMKGGEPVRINPPVDLYNAVSLRHVVPAGGFDLAAVDGDLELRLSRERDRFDPLGGGEAEEVAPGEVSYAVEREILTRHFVWRQSRLAALHSTTTEAVLLSEILGGIEDEVAAAALHDLSLGLEQLLGAEEIHGAVLRAEQPEFAA